MRQAMASRTYWQQKRHASTGIFYSSEVYLEDLRKEELPPFLEIQLADWASRLQKLVLATWDDPQYHWYTLQKKKAKEKWDLIRKETKNIQQDFQTKYNKIDMLQLIMSILQSVLCSREISQPIFIWLGFQ